MLQKLQCPGNPCFNLPTKNGARGSLYQPIPVPYPVPQGHLDYKWACQVVFSVGVPGGPIPNNHIQWSRTPSGCSKNYNVQATLVSLFPIKNGARGSLYQPTPVPYPVLQGHLDYKWAWQVVFSVGVPWGPIPNNHTQWSRTPSGCSKNYNVKTTLVFTIPT